MRGGSVRRAKGELRPEADRPRFADALADREFRAIFGADLLSLLGDQTALIALVVVVFQRTGSAFLSAAVLAVSFLPSLVGGPLLAALADRWPRRRLMVACDGGRVLLTLVVALPLLPVGAVFPIVFAIAVLASPFEAARSALLPEILEGERYVAGTALMHGTYQIAQVAGYVLGGIVVSQVGVLPVLLVDAATFVVSGLVLTLGVRPGFVVRPKQAQARTSLLTDAILGARVVFRDAVLRSVLLLACTTAMFVVVPEALAASYAAELGGGSVLTGLLLAAPSVGAVIGVLVVGRLLPPRLRTRALRPLSILALTPLLITVFQPPVAVLLTAWVLAGVGTGLHIAASVTFVAHTPATMRGRAFGLAQSGVAVVQGIGFLAGGALAQVAGPAATVTLAAGTGLVLLVPLLLTWPDALRNGASPPEAIALDAPAAARVS